MPGWSTPGHPHGKDADLGYHPFHDFAVNAAWLTAARTGQILLA